MLATWLKVKAFFSCKYNKLKLIIIMIAAGHIFKSQCDPFCDLTFNYHVDSWSLQKVDNAIQWINLFPLNNAIGFPSTNIL